MLTTVTATLELNSTEAAIEITNNQSNNSTFINMQGSSTSPGIQQNDDDWNARKLILYATLLLYNLMLVFALCSTVHTLSSLKSEL